MNLSGILIFPEYVFLIYENVYYIWRERYYRSTLSIHRNGCETHWHHSPALLYDDPSLSPHDYRSTFFSRTSLYHLSCDHIFYDHERKILLSWTLLTLISCILSRDRSSQFDTRDIYRGDLVWGIYVVQERRQRRWAWLTWRAWAWRSQSQSQWPYYTWCSWWTWRSSQSPLTSLDISRFNQKSHRVFCWSHHRILSKSLQ